MTSTWFFDETDFVRRPFNLPVLPTMKRHTVMRIPRGNRPWRTINRNRDLECCDPASTRHHHTLADCEFRTTDIPNNNRARRIFACDPERAYAAVAAGLASDNS